MNEQPIIGTVIGCRVIVKLADGRFVRHPNCGVFAFRAWTERFRSNGVYHIGPEWVAYGPRTWIEP